MNKGVYGWIARVWTVSERVIKRESAPMKVCMYFRLMPGRLSILVARSVGSNAYRLQSTPCDLASAGCNTIGGPASVVHRW